MSKENERQSSYHLARAEVHAEESVRQTEQACGTREELQDLVHDVVVEYTAEMLGVPPESLDPVYRRRY